MKKLISVLLLISFCSLNIIAEDNDSFDDIDFPQWTKDLRRTEIITFGSLPFVTLWVTMGYSVVVQGEFHNPLNKSTTRFSPEDQKKIIGIAAATSLSLGLTDLLINIITRNIHKNKQKKVKTPITIIPSKDFALNDIILDQDISESSETYITDEKDYLIGELEDAIF